MRFSSSLLILGLSALSSAQGTPSQGGNSATWEIRYKGQVKVGTTVFWDAPDWVSAGPGFYTGGFRQVQALSGSVMVRFRWNGGTTYPIPNRLNAIINYTVGMTAPNATADNNFTQASGTTSATAGGKYLVQRAGSSEIIFSYNPSATLSPVPGISSNATCGMGLGASIDPRFATITLGGAGTSMKPFVTGFNKSFSITGADTPLTKVYPEALPMAVAEDTPSTMWSKTIDIGLPEGKQSRTGTFGGTVLTQENLATLLSYTANVYQNLVPNETYNFSSGTQTVSETLPTTDGFGNAIGWDILGVSDSAINPCVIVVDNVFDREDTNDLSTTKSATLTYSWQDGLIAKAKLNVNLRRAVEQVGDLAVSKCTQWQSPAEVVPLSGGTASAGNTSWPYPEVPADEMYKWVSNTLSVGGKLIQYKPAALVCTVLNVVVGSITPATINGSFPRRDHIDTSLDTVDWGAVTPGITYDVALFAWKASTIPRRDDHWIVVDRYGMSGFIERAPMLAGSKMRTHIQRTEDTGRYRWIYTGPGSGR